MAVRSGAGHERSQEERDALVVIRRVEPGGSYDWLRSPGPDLQLRLPCGRSVIVEITRLPDADAREYWAAINKPDDYLHEAPGLAFGWTLFVGQGNRRINEVIPRIQRVLKEIEGKGGCRESMLEAARERFRRTYTLISEYGYLAQFLEWKNRQDQANLPSLREWVRDGKLHRWLLV